MEWQTSPYLIPLGFTALVGLSMAFLGWRNRATTGAVSFAVLMLLTAWWSTFYLVEIAAVSLSGKLGWIQLQYIGISLSTIFYFRFVLQFIGESDHVALRPRWFALWFIVPLITQLGLLTNGRYHLFYSTTAIDTSSGASMIVTTYGPLFWLNTAQSYLLLVFATYKLVRHLMTATDSNLYRNQINLMLLGLAAPWLANFVTLSGLSPFANLDLTPFAFTLTGLALGVSLFRYKLLDVMPIARHLLVQQLPEGVMVLDSRLRIVDINPALHRLFPALPKEPLGRSLAEVFADQPELLPHFSATENSKFEVTLADTSYAVHLTMLRSNTRQLDGKLAVFIDISKQKEAEAYLSTARSAAQSAQKKAAAAEAMARATAQAKDNFLTTMSHEIRTPINAIVGTGQLLHDTPLSSEQKELLNTIQQSSDALLGLINNILDYSLLEAGNLNLGIRPFSLTDSINAVYQTLAPAARQKNLTLSRDIQSDLPEFFDGDPVRLRQILFNLLHNSIKFSEEGVIALHVTGVETAVDQFQLRFRLTDQGIGIPAAKLDQLFQSFHQVDNSLTRAQGGLGLGLAISNSLCRLMGGEFQVQSTVGQGSQFTFTIQVHRASERPSDMPAHGAISLSGKRLLIISKDQANRRRLSRDAKAAGITAYVAGGATDAIYWLQKSDPFDVLLLDTAILARNAHLIGQLHNKSDGVPILLLENGKAPALTSEQQTQIASSIRLPLKTSAFYDALHNLFARASQGARPLSNESMGERLPLRILLVEDNRINQKVAQNLLKKLGYTIEIVENGQLALDRFAQQQFDVILMDIQMPVMDGVEATKRIRRDFPPEAQPYIIAVTAHALEGDRETYLAAGMDDYISKPIKTEKLVAALHQAGNRERPLAPTTPPLTPAPTATQSDAPDAQTPIDYAELEMLLGEPPAAFLAEMGPEFINDTEMLLQTLHTAVQSSDTDQIRRTAHTLKGTSASLGMPVLSARSKELELIAKSGALAQAPEKLTQIETAFADIRPLLHAVKAEVDHE